MSRTFRRRRNDRKQTEFLLTGLLLPPVEVRVAKPVGEIRRLIEPATLVPVDARRVPLGGRRKGSILELLTRRYLLDAARSSIDRENLHGSLVSDSDRLRWAWNRAQEGEAASLNDGQTTRFRDSIRATWQSSFCYKDAATAPDGCGLRSAQLGALHSLAAHWTLSNEIATVVMPTGTGKTETMLSLLLTRNPTCMLVVVPSRALQEQTAYKFRTLGVLPELGVSLPGAQRPVVGVLRRRPRCAEDLEIFDRCNVVVAVVNTIAQGTAVPLLTLVAEKCSHLVLDEAHHVAAASWSVLQQAFSRRSVVQFTATPFREDRSPIKGKIVYNFPLARAQSEGFFRAIRFESVFEADSHEADAAIARKAVDALRRDLSANRDHRIIARCQTTKRAAIVFEIYRRLAPEMNPVLVHTGTAGVSRRIDELRCGASKIVVCVNMLAEGFDLPQLKLAALHDKFKSLAITLQFIGRVTRVGDPTLGDATVVANTGDAEVAREIQALYDEDADWNSLIAGLSFDRIEEEHRFGEFLRNARDFGHEIPENEIAAKIAPQTMVPRFNAVVFHAAEFNPAGIQNGLEPGHRLVRAWTLDAPKLVFFVTRLVEPPPWTKNREICDSSWNLITVYHDPDRRLLYIGSSTDSGSSQQRLAEAVGGPSIRPIKDEEVFKVFRQVNRLFLLQVGLLKQGPRNLRYSMFTGTDVADAIDRIVRGDSQKSNIFGNGFRGGAPIGIGCSRKGKIWGRDAGTIQEWTRWCDEQGTHLLSNDFDSSQLIRNALTAATVTEMPRKRIWHLDWPSDLWERDDLSFTLVSADHQGAIHSWCLRISSMLASDEGVEFTVEPSEPSASLPSVFSMKIGAGCGVAGYQVMQVSGPVIELRVGNGRRPLADYFADRPPIIRFTDQSELEGCSYVVPHVSHFQFNAAQIVPIDWPSEMDHRVESQWTSSGLRPNSIQSYAITRCISEGYDVVFDDDGANEIADVVALKDLNNGLQIRLVHCKYSHGDDPGSRVSDVVEVTSQAIKNVKWFWNSKQLHKRLIQRHGKARAVGRERFQRGSLTLLRKLVRVAELGGVLRREVIVVQPGLSAGAISPAISAILGAADEYVHARINTPLTLWCSS